MTSLQHNSLWLVLFVDSVQKNGYNNHIIVSFPAKEINVRVHYVFGAFIDWLIICRFSLIKIMLESGTTVCALIRAVVNFL